MAAPKLAAYVQGLSSVTADNLNTFEQTCDNYAEMRGLVGLPGMQISVRGASSANDGGQGVYYWLAGSTSPDNNNTIIVPTGAATGAWVRLLPGVGINAAYSFATTAALLAAFPSYISLPTDTIAFTVARDASDTQARGGGWFWYNSSDTTTADNGGTIRVDAAGRRWYFQANQLVFVDLFGAYTVNTAANNNTPLQNALNWLRSTVSGNYSRAVLYVGYGTYNFSTGLDLTAPSSGSSYPGTFGMRIQGMGNYVSNLVGTLAAAIPALDASGQPNLTISGVKISGGGTASCGFMNLAIPQSATSLGSTSNNSCEYDFWADCTSSTGVAGMVTSSNDTSFYTINFSATCNGASTGNPNTSVTGGCGLCVGWVPPSRANDVGVCQGGTSTTIVLPTTASSVNGYYVGYPIRKYTGSNIGAAGTYEFAYITAYVGSTKTATVSKTWSVNPVSGTDWAVVHCVKSAYNQLAGCGAGAGLTYLEIGAQEISSAIGIYWTTGGVLQLNDPYISISGQAVNGGAVWCDGTQELTGSALGGRINAEVYGSGNIYLVNTINNGGIGSIDWPNSRPAGPFTALFACDSSTYSGYGNIQIGSIDTINSQPIFALASGKGVGSLTIWDGSASAIGSASGSIGVLNGVAGVSTSSTAAPVQSGTIANGSGNSTQILGTNAVLGSIGSGNAIGASLKGMTSQNFTPTVTTTSTTGGSSQIRYSFAIPANTLYYNGGVLQLALVWDMDIVNNEAGSTTAIVLYANQGSNQSLCSFTLGNGATAHAHVTIDGEGGVSYLVTSGTSILTSGAGTISLTPSNAWSVNSYENNASANASSRGLTQFQRIRTT